MVARKLRRVAAAQALGVALLAYVLHRFASLGLPAALAASLAALFGLYLLLTLATFALCWPRGKDAIPGQHPSVFATCSMILAEALSVFALFAVIQPFADSLFSIKRKQRRESERPPVLLVHGYACNSALWWWMIGRLRAWGFEADAIDLEPPLGDIEGFADQLNAHIEDYLKESGAKKLRLVTHSMGGLVARTYLQRYGAARVDKLITLACPHHGTRLARLGRGLDAREMEPPSAFLAALGEPAPVSAVSIWSGQDNFLAPQTSSHLAGAREVMLTGVGHLTFVFSPRVLALVLKELGES